MYIYLNVYKKLNTTCWNNTPSLLKKESHTHSVKHTPCSNMGSPIQILILLMHTHASLCTFLLSFPWAMNTVGLYHKIKVIPLENKGHQWDSQNPHLYNRIYHQSRPSYIQTNMPGTFELFKHKKSDKVQFVYLRPWSLSPHHCRSWRAVWSLKSQPMLQSLPYFWWNKTFRILGGWQDVRKEEKCQK